MRITITKTVTAIVLLLAVFFTAGCTAETVSEKTPSNYEQLHGLIGKPITEACKVLGLDEAEVLAANERKENYRLPSTVDFAGITWNVDLSFDWGREVVLAFLYIRDYGSNTEQASKDATKLAAHLVKHYGERENPTDNDLNELSVEALQEKIANTEYFSKKEVWAQNDQITDAMRTFYAEAIEDNTGGYVPENLRYEMNLQYDAKHHAFARLTLEYRFRAI